jgi:sialidase-1
LDHDDELNCPRCQASLIRHDTPLRNYLIFSNPATGGRNGMSIRVSADAGETWPVEKLIYPRSSAYSNLVVTDDENVLCLFEGGPAQYHVSGIASIRIPLEELSIQ